MLFLGGCLTRLVAGHKVRIVKFMGDGMLVEFPSAVNAVQCIVELQRRAIRLRRMQREWRGVFHEPMAQGGAAGVSSRWWEANISCLAL